MFIQVNVSGKVNLEVAEELTAEDTLPTSGLAANYQIGTIQLARSTMALAASLNKGTVKRLCHAMWGLSHA